MRMPAGQFTTGPNHVVWASVNTVTDPWMRTVPASTHRSERHNHAKELHPMKAARFYDRNDIRIEDIPAPEALSLIHI